jgi:hypothetical protein
MLIYRAALVFCLLLVPTSAAADCLYNGRQYAEGSRVGGLTCENGRWVRR